MSFKPPFEVGAIVSNAVMTEAFKVGNMGGMRRSKTTGTLVLISDNTKGLYHDKWHDGILHYTGMGIIGDQVLRDNQNKTLAESDTNGVEVHLFEVDTSGKYTYQGVVKFAGEPYQETQPDDNGDPRKVWIFPLKKAFADNMDQALQEQKQGKNWMKWYDFYGRRQIMNTFLGDADYVRHEGERPVSFTWKLHAAIPAELLPKANKSIAM